MAQAVARDGYAGASVTRVIELAGVSRATFYEHFDNREDCLLTAQRGAAERARRCIGAEDGRRVRLSAAIEDILVRAAENPAAAQLLLIAAPGATKAVRHQSERFLAAIEAVIDDSLEARPAPQLPAASLLDGIAGVIATRLLQGDGDTLPCLSRDLLAWSRAYRLPAGERRLSQAEWTALGRSLAPAEPAREADLSLLPRGRSALDPAAGAALRRRRIVAATAQLVSRKGFAGLTVADITAAARVPRSGFYAQFAGKEDAFLAVQDEFLHEAIGAAASRFALGSSWPERVWNGLEGLLYYIAERPDLAHAGIVEMHSAGPRASLRSSETCLAFTLFLEEGFRRLGGPEGDARPCGEAIAFAIQGAMRRAILAAGPGRLPELLPLCSHIALAPFIGPGRSLELVERMGRGAG
jgi:AcrR family transcriptional regulator